jgi:heterodisulfide reductase subunit A-like polyferredoxin
MIMGLETPTRVAPTVAQQIFVIGSGIAGGLAGFALAKEFTNVKDVSTPLVIGTTIVSIFFTLGAGFYLARKAKGVPIYG